MHPVTSRFAILMGSASLLSLTTALTAHAQDVAQTVQVTPQQLAQAQAAQAATPAPAATAAAAPANAVPEQVLVTGSLIHGTAAVGVPVTNLGTQDFTESGEVSIGDLFRTVPAANVAPGPSATNSGGHQERETRVNLRGLDATGPRSLLMVDGVRFPPQADGLCAIDPSIIPQLALDRVDILADGASATYGSDAIAGVINVILKRGFEGATTLLHFGQPTDGGGTEYQASQLWGRTWDGGDITLTYEYDDQQPIKGNVHSKFTTNFNPWGLEDPYVSIASAIPGVVSTGKPKVVTSIPADEISAPGGVPVPGLVDGVCTNCFSIPRGTGANWSAGTSGVGPTAPGSASTISWASLMGNTGDNNFVDPLSLGWEQAAQQKNSFVATVDQQLFPGVSFFGTGFYTNRRVQEVLPSYGGQGINNYQTVWSIPTINPYYPAGAPAGLNVAYNLAAEVPPTIPAWEISERYQFGLNLDLPYSWTGQIYDSRSYEDVGFVRHYISTPAVNAALGWEGGHAGGTQAQASNPTTGAPIPFLNLFCDPTQFRCNSPETLAYIGATGFQGAHYSIDEKGARFDGPLFDLPGGQVKAAIGGLYDGDDVVGWSGTNNGQLGNPPVNQSTTYDPEPYHIWAEFAQLDIPIFGDNFNFPLLRKLDIEGSVRHDSYGGNVNLTGSTTNPKVAFTWVIDELVGATVRGSWGSSFRFANEGEFSNILSPTDQSAYLQLLCIGGQAPKGSATADLVAAGLGCGNSFGGISYGGGPEAVLRNFVNDQGEAVTRENGVSVLPEKATNYSLGVEFAPTIDFLRGFDLQVTYYSVKINNVLTSFLGAMTPSGLADPTQRFHFILPSDTGCPVSANANPTTCAPFQKMVAAAMNDPNFDNTVVGASNVFWINDSGLTNAGFVHVEGFDWTASYNYDAGDWGAWNAGITGTYYLHRFIQQVAGGTVIDALDQNLGSIGGVAQNGVETLPRTVFRTRLGWSDGPYNATFFWNHSSHFFEILTGTPPNVNFQCTTAGGTIGGGTYPCAISNYSNYQPAFDTFDLSLGYSTGTVPSNVYLQNVTLQLTVLNILGLHAPFEYGPTFATRNPSGFDIRDPNTGRTVGLTLVKNW